MKTPEEILQKWEAESSDRLLDQVDYYERVIIPSMEEYTSNQCKKRDELIQRWEFAFDFILKYIDYEKMSHEDTLKIWHLDHLQKITDLKTEINNKPIS
jgi:hypothetical protein